MTAIQIVMKRTGMSAEDAAFYVSMADARILAYLKLPAGSDLTPYVFQEADIAVLYWQRDQSTQNSASTLGLKSASFSEGGVSKSETAMDGASIQSIYEDQIDDVLARLDGNGGLVVFI